MAKLLISTQVYENYGDTIKPHFKPKGGSDYVVKNFNNKSFLETTEIVMALRPQVECDNEYFHEYIVDWIIEEDDYLTPFERDQLEFEGVIRFSPKELFI
jgi:hypothetical protein